MSFLWSLFPSLADVGSTFVIWLVDVVDSLNLPYNPIRLAVFWDRFRFFTPPRADFENLSCWNKYDLWEGNWEVPNFEGDGGNFPDIIKSVFRACWTPSGVENVWVWCRHLPPSHHRPSRREGWHPFPTFITGLGGSCKETIIIRLNYNPSASGTWPLQSSSSGAILVFIIVVGV